MRLWGAGARQREAGDPQQHPVEPVERAQLREAAREALGAESFAAAWDAGRRLPLEQLLSAENLANSVLEHRARAAQLPAGLTRRELEVLLLVADGLSNTEIAERLVISPDTVVSYLNLIYQKLDVSSRTAAMRYAIDHQLSEPGVGSTPEPRGDARRATQQGYSVIPQVFGVFLWARRRVYSSLRGAEESQWHSTTYRSGFGLGSVAGAPTQESVGNRRGSCGPAGSRGHGKTEGVCVCSCCIRPATRSKGGLTMSHTRLVVVADDSIVRLDLCGLLQALGYQVVGEAGDGPAAITLARSSAPI